MNKKWQILKKNKSDIPTTTMHSLSVWNGCCYIWFILTTPLRPFLLVGTVSFYFYFFNPPPPPNTHAHTHKWPLSIKIIPRCVSRVAPYSLQTQNKILVLCCWKLEEHVTEIQIKLNTAKHLHSSQTTIKIPSLKNVETRFWIMCRTWNNYLR